MATYPSTASSPTCSSRPSEWRHSLVTSEADRRSHTTSLARSVHPWVAASHLRWFVSDFVIKRVLWFLTGTSAGCVLFPSSPPLSLLCSSCPLRPRRCAQWVGELPPERLGRAYVFLNKSHKAATFLNRPYRNRSKLMSLVSEYHDPPEDSATPGVVEMAPWPVGFDESGAVKWDWEACGKKGGSWKRVKARMEDRRVEPKCVCSRLDSRWRSSAKSLSCRLRCTGLARLTLFPPGSLVIFASGYKQEFSSWLSNEYPRPWDADVRDIVSSGTPDVAFLGFVRPGVGAIPPIAEQQSMWWTAFLQGKMQLPTDPPHYYLLSRPEARIQYGVDHSTYMSTLARDQGSAPSLWQLLREHGAFITLVYCFSASFTSHYRLLGPFRSDTAPEVVRTEIWDTVKRRGWIVRFVSLPLPRLSLPRTRC